MRIVHALPERLCCCTRVQLFYFLNYFVCCKYLYYLQVIPGNLWKTYCNYFQLFARNVPWNYWYKAPRMDNMSTRPELMANSSEPSRVRACGYWINQLGDISLNEGRVPASQPGSDLCWTNDNPCLEWQHDQKRRRLQICCQFIFSPLKKHN